MKPKEIKKVTITDAKSYVSKRFQCENSCLKREDPHTEVVWCSEVDRSCRFAICPKIQRKKRRK